jgi:hypothetical protein
MSLIVIASSFYTASLEKSFERALDRDGKTRTVRSVPYNQLLTFLLDPRSVIPEGTTCQVLLLLRVEDFIRLDLTALAGKTTAEEGTCLRLLRERELQFLDVLSSISHLRLTVIICPAGLGAFDTAFLGNATRVAEFKIAAEFRRQQKHMVIGWREFAKPEKLGAWLSPTADRLGHVPFTPAGLQAIADFFVGQLERMPISMLESDSGDKGGLTLERFLGSLAVEVSLSPLIQEDEQPVRNLVRHTTHFINQTGGDWDNALSVSNTRFESWIVRVADRFGSYGISGAVVFVIEADKMLVDYLFLSCPVLGKQVELALFSWMADVAEQRGAAYIEIPFVSGRDNSVLAEPLARFSGESLPSSVAGTRKHFVLRVDGLKDWIAAQAPNREAFSAIVANLEVGEFV